MKKIIITAISAIAVIASVIGCQIYDSQTNNVLESWMNKNGSDIQKYEEYSNKFNAACVAMCDSSADADALNEIADTYLGYDKFYAAALTAVQTNISSVIEAALEDLSADLAGDAKKAEKMEEKRVELRELYNSKIHDKDWVIKTYKEVYFTRNFVYNNLITKLIDGKTYKTVADLKKKYKDLNATQFNKKSAFWTTVSIEAYTGVNYSLYELYQDVYDLRWDYNSKK